MNLGEKIEKLERDNKSLKTILGGVATLPSYPQSL